MDSSSILSGSFVLHLYSTSNPDSATFVITDINAQMSSVDFSGYVSGPNTVTSDPTFNSTGYLIISTGEIGYETKTRTYNQAFGPGNPIIGVGEGWGRFYSTHDTLDFTYAGDIRIPFQGPTLSQWGVIVLVMAITGVTVWILVKRRKAIAL